MNTRERLLEGLSKSIHELITSDDFKKVDKEVQIKSLEVFFHRIYDDIQNTADETIDKLAEQNIYLQSEEHFLNERNSYTSGFFVVIIIGMALSILNNFFNVLPKFSFLESFGAILLLINVYTLISFFIRRN